jgi:hypothetical protein
MIRRASRAALLALTLTSLGACALFLGDYHDVAGGAGGGTGGQTSQSGCADDGACATGDRCSLGACVAGACVTTALPDGPIDGNSDATADCVTLACRGGKETQVPAAETPPGSGPCKAVSCSAGEIVTTYATAGTACGQSPLKCDGQGICLGCNADADCPAAPTCTTRHCDTATHACSNVSLPSGTTCTGGFCDGAGACAACLEDSDCTSPKVCISHACTSSCADLAKDGTESDVDCGGSCARCATGKSCHVGADCVSGVCSVTTCAAATCFDNVPNGSESDVDCGGSACPKCATGKACLDATDCASGYCAAATHVCATPTCSDAARNGAETDVDCGGGACPKCADGKACGNATDCASDACTAGTCRPLTCSDLLKDGTETDVDCGGGTCAPCAAGRVCNLNLDCASGVCKGNGTCQ